MGIVQYKQLPTQDELEWLHEAEWVLSVAQSPGWMILKKRMKSFVDAAQTTIDESLSSNAEVVYRLHLRRQVIKGVVDDIVNYVEGVAEERRRVITELESEPMPIPQRIGDEFESGEEIDEYTSA